MKKILILDGSASKAFEKYGYTLKNTDFFEKFNKYNETIVQNIHKRYIDAGADIIETNSFNANDIYLKQFNKNISGYELSFLAAKIANKAKYTYNKNILIAGSVGPSHISLSLDKNFYEELKNSFKNQINGLIKGGVDFLLFETCYDFENLKLLLTICQEENFKKNIVVSFNVNDVGKIFSGESIFDIINYIDNNFIIGYGINCSNGIEKSYNILKQLRNFTNKKIFFYPNVKQYKNEDEKNIIMNNFKFFAEKIIKENLVDVFGSCCGTDEEFTQLIKNILLEKQIKL